eukprot:9125965-Pyramimonas_sp.AAC.1
MDVRGSRNSETTHVGPLPSPSLSPSPLRGHGRDWQFRARARGQVDAGLRPWNAGAALTSRVEERRDGGR